MEKGNCCSNKKGVLRGLLFGIIPHSFCIAFIVLSIIGVSTATIFFKRFLLTPYFFQLLIAISFLFTTISAIIYLKRSGCLCGEGIKNKWKYLSILYSTTILTNLLLFLVVFPALANMNANNSDNGNLISMSIEVKIPCSGHAPLIIDELKNNGEVDIVKFKLPNIFEIKYDSEKTSPEAITSLEIFETYGVSIQ